MKKRILFLLFSVMAVSSVVMVACKKDNLVGVDQSLQNRLSKDVLFENTILAATDMGMNLDVEALSKDANIEILKSIAARINNKTAIAADYEQIKAITGVSYDEFIGKLQTFGMALYELNKAYPELGKMKQDDMSALFGKAIQSNPEINSLVVNPIGSTLRVGACPLQDICKLAVVLAKIFGGDALCLLIGTATIPIIGGLLCQLILSVGVAILNGICGVLPC
jgi:hypothetical protein